MSNVLTREAKVKVGFDIDQQNAKKGFEANAKAAEQLEKAIDKVGARFKQTKDEFATSKTQAITNAFGIISRAAQTAEGDIAKMFQGFAVITNVISMFGALNGSIQNTVRSLKEMKAVGGTLTQLQGAQYAGGGLVGAAGAAGAGAVGTVAGRTAGGMGTAIAGSAIGGALVNAAGQFATTQGTAQVKGAIEQAVNKLGDKVASRADNLFDSVIDSVIPKKGSAIGKYTGGRGGVMPGVNSRFQWDPSRWVDGAYNADFEVKKPLLLGRELTLGEYTRDALMNARPSTVPQSGLSRWLHQAGTEFGSPKNRMHFLQGGLAGGTLGALAGGMFTGSSEGAMAGGGIGSVVGSVGNLAMGGGMMKGMAALANPIGAALAGAVAVAAAAFIVKGGKYGDKIADSIAGWFVSFFDDSAAKAQKRLAAKQAEMARREQRDQVLIPIQNARQQAFEGIRAEQSAMMLRGQLVNNGMAGAGLDASIMFGDQGVSEASQRLIAANNARYGGRLSTAEFAAASQDFEAQMAAQRQLIDTKMSGQLAMIDPEIAKARQDEQAATTRLSWMHRQNERIGQGAGGIKKSERGFTDADFTDQIEKAEQATRRLMELEKQRVDIKRTGLEFQKQEFGVYREQAKAAEQAARSALEAKKMRISSAREEFALMSDSDREQLMEVAKEYKEKGFAGLSEANQKFVTSKQNFFGGVKLQDELSGWAQSKGFGTLAEMLPGLAGGTAKEEADLKKAQAMRVEIERNIVAQLQVNEATLADEMATKVGPYLKSLEIILVTKFDNMMKQALGRLGSQQAQQGNMQR